MSKPVLLVICGAHTSGKSTLASNLSRKLGFRVTAEVGDECQRRKVDSHLIPDMERELSILAQEELRDLDRGAGAVVETWHPGNLAWAKLRSGSLPGFFELEQRTLSAMQRAACAYCLTFVCLDIDTNTMRRRRRQHEAARNRIPLSSDAEDQLSPLMQIYALTKQYLQAYFPQCAQITVDNNDDAALDIVEDKLVQLGLRAAACAGSLLPDQSRFLVPYATCDAALLVLSLATRVFDSLVQPVILIRDRLQRLQTLASSSSSTSKPLSTFVIEGLDGTGKSTLVANLKQYFPQAKFLQTPPFDSELRATFDDKSIPPAVRRAFYMVCNYVASLEAAVSSEPIVFIDRFYFSTAVYSLAEQPDLLTPQTQQDLKFSLEDLLRWPRDMAPVTQTFVLTITKEERERRISKRGAVGFGREEEQQRDDPTLSDRLALWYDHVAACNPTTVSLIDANRPPEKVSDEVVRCVTESLLRQADSEAKNNNAAASSAALNNP